MQCRSVRTDGKRCTAHALKGRHYCMFHNKPGVKRNRNRRNKL